MLLETDSFHSCSNENNSSSSDSSMSSKALTKIHRCEAINKRRNAAQSSGSRLTAVAQFAGEQSYFELRRPRAVVQVSGDHLPHPLTCWSRNSQLIASSFGHYLLALCASVFLMASIGCAQPLVKLNHFTTYEQTRHNVECAVREELVNLTEILPNSANGNYDPPFLLLHRCGGLCRKSLSRCETTSSYTQVIQVFHQVPYQYGKINITVEHAEECSCSHPHHVSTVATNPRQKRPWHRNPAVYKCNKCQQRMQHDPKIACIKMIRRPRLCRLTQRKRQAT